MGPGMTRYFHRSTWLTRLLGGLIFCVLMGLALPLSAQPSLSDLPYGSDPKQRLDVYLPDSPDNAPLIVMVHGGGWRFGDKSNEPVWRNKVAHWTALGAVVVSVNYRLLPQAGPLEQAQDVARALAYIQTKAPQWGAHPQKLVLMGHSAGGHLVSLLSADPSLAWDLGAHIWLATVSLDSAVLDTQKIMAHRPSKLYAQAFGADPAYWEQVSPIARLQPTAPPMLLVCSSRRARPCPQAQSFANRLTSLGGSARILPINMSHRSINEAIGLHPAYTAELDAFLRDAGLWDS